MKDINEDNLEFNFYDDKESKYKKEIPSLIKIKEKSEKENKDIFLIEAVSGREKKSNGNYSKIKIKFLKNNIYYFPDGKKKEYADKLNDFFIDDDNIYFFFIKPFLDKYFENHNNDNENLKDTMQQAYDRENILPSYNIKYKNSKNDDKKTRIYTKDHYPLLSEILRLEKKGKNYGEIRSALYGDFKREEYNEKIDDDNLEEYIKNIYSKFDDVKLYDESDEDIHPVIYYHQKLYHAPFKIYESFVRKKINISEYKFFISICKENFYSINKKRKEEIDYIYENYNNYNLKKHNKVLFKKILKEIDINIKETYKDFITLNDRIISFQLQNNIHIKKYNTDVPEEILNILYFTDYMEQEEYTELKNKISKLKKLEIKDKIIIECPITSEDEKIIYNTAKSFKFEKMNYISLYKIIKLNYDNSNLENTFKENISLMKNYDKIYNLVKSNQ
ncbi:hypothetical protein R4K55_08295 [Brachyspira alvinipulli]|uniref:hypothetical protein n=1 Tax=Brachyspira alvinipulli TaxID=84379 RepID=UPI0030058146